MTLSPVAAPSSSNEGSETLKYGPDRINHHSNTPPPPSPTSPNHEPSNGTVCEPVHNGHPSPLPSGRVDNVNPVNGSAVITNGHRYNQNHDDSEDHYVAAVNGDVVMPAPLAVNPTLPESHTVLRSDSGSELDNSVADGSGSEREFDKRSDVSGGDLLGDEIDRRTNGSDAELLDEINRRSNDSNPELLDDEDPNGIVQRLKLPERPPTPPRSNRKAVVDQPPQKLISILRPPRRYSEAPSDGTLLDSPNGSTNGSHKANRKSVSFSDVPELVPPLKIKSTKLPVPLLKRVERSAKTRKTLIATQNDVDVMRRRYNHDRSLFVSAAQEMLDVTLPLMSLVDVMPIEAKLKSSITESWNRFKLQGSELIAQDRYLKESDRTLEKVEALALEINTNLLEREIKLFETYDRFDVPERHNRADSVGDDDDGTVSAVSASSWEDPTVREYYDKIGEVSLAMDHLHNLDTDHVSRLYSWESARQRGVQVTAKQLDAIFAEYFRERKALITHYMRCRYETGIFYQLCLELKLEVEPPNLPPEDFTTLDSSLRPTAWDMRGIDATSMEGGGSEEELRHRGSEPSKRAAVNTGQLSKEKVWSWLRLVPDQNNPGKTNYDAAPFTHRESQPRFISGIVDSVGVQSQLAPETKANPNPDPLLPELDRFPFDQFHDGRRSRRRDSDPEITNDLTLRLKLRDNHKGGRRSSSITAIETRTAHDFGEPDQVAVVRDFQKEIAIRNVALFYLDPSAVPDLPPAPPRPVGVPESPPEIPPPPAINPVRAEPEDLPKAPSEDGLVVPPPRPPPPPPEGFQKGPPIMPEQPPVRPPPDVTTASHPPNPPVMPPPDVTAASHPPNPPVMPPPDAAATDPPPHPPVMPPPPHPPTGHPNGLPTGPVVQPPYPPPPPPSEGLPPGQRLGPPPPAPRPPRNQQLPRSREGPPTMPQGPPLAQPPPLMPPPNPDVAKAVPAEQPGPRTMPSGPDQPPPPSISVGLSNAQAS